MEGQGRAEDPDDGLPGIGPGGVVYYTTTTTTTTVPRPTALYPHQRPSSHYPQSNASPVASSVSGI